MTGGLSPIDTFNHLVYNVFLPLQLPQSELSEDSSKQVNLLIARSVIRSIRQYKLEDIANGPQWSRMARMIGYLEANLEVPLSKTSLASDIAGMEVDGERAFGRFTGADPVTDVLALYIRAQNASVIVRKGLDSTTFEIFEVQVPAEDVMSNPGKLLLQYPGPSVQIPQSIASDPRFIEEISNFLAQSDAKSFEEAVATTEKAGSSVRETRETTDPNYFTQLFLGIVGGMGKVFVPPRIVKRIADEVLWKRALHPWRRSPIWLVIRVTIQTSLNSRSLYKNFMAYHLSTLITECLDQFSDDFSSELLFMMRAKMARRLFKIQDSVPSFVVESGRAAAERSQTILEQRWTAVQEAQARASAWDPSTLDLDNATNITLRKSSTYISGMFGVRNNKIEKQRFIPSSAPRLDDVQDFSEYANGGLDRTFLEHNHIALFDFESCVHKHLMAWVDRQHLDAESACQIVYSCFQQYLSAARAHYTVDAADQSIMVLTLTSLWVAIDRLAALKCELLLQFPPEIPANILDPLLLRSSEHLEQANLIQLYLLSREDRAKSTNNSIFSDSFNSSCFAVQYFRQTPALQNLKSTIEASAHESRRTKIAKLEELNRDSARLSERAEQMKHDWVFDEGYSGDRHTLRHAKSCGRCGLERRSRSMSITPHEWPLPANEDEAMATIFELRRPIFFTIWRDATYQVLRDLATESKAKKTAHITTTLEDYDDLKMWQNTTNSVPARVTFASSTKSFQQSHYSKVNIPASKSSVCVNNGLRFHIYDKVGGTSAAGPFRPNLTKYGTFTIPKSSPYHHLSNTVGGTTHTSNQVLADQHDCPKSLSFHEHIAFGSLRSGPRLQWLNIARGLQENVLTFNRAEVGLLHAQAVWQIGPLSEDLSIREWHTDLEEPKFRALLVTQCSSLLERVQGNWLEANSVYIIVLIVTRLLAASSSAENGGAYKLLASARRVAFQWLSELLSKIQESESESKTLDYQHLACEIAIICRSTFDVGCNHLSNVLKTQEDFTVLMNSAIAVHDNQPSAAHATEQSLGLLMCREHRFAHRLAPYIQQLSTKDSQIFSPPLSHIWPDYRRSVEGWKPLQGADKCWVSTSTMAHEGSGSQTVHFNIISGKLLVDGMPLGQLPQAYRDNVVFTRVFGDKLLRVIPANTKGMEFVTRNRVHGHQDREYEVFFALDKTRNQLVIQARKDGQILQLVPHSEISADLPESFSTNYHHWANPKTKSIEFRSFSHPWSHKHCEWTIRFGRNGTVMENLENKSLLVDIRSLLFQSVSAQLAPLESPGHLHISRSTDSQIQVILPRMKLQFVVNQDLQIESRNFRGHVIDPNQSTGTLFGLKNQLVLCAKHAEGQKASRSRSLLIPHGEISVTKLQHHVLVTIQPGTGPSVPFHRYIVDTDLGCLRSDTGLTSRLFKIYLHGLTSHCLPDKLTERTGTEEALHELVEPATSSFEQIDEEQVKLLMLIGSLTPKQNYYPPHLKRMQTTIWADIPVLSQHYGFISISESILRHSETLQLFSPLGSSTSGLIVSTDRVLFNRAVQRATLFYPLDLAIQVHQFSGNVTLSDPHHSSIVHERLALDWTIASQSAAGVFVLLSQNQNQSRKPLDLVSWAESWRSLSSSCEEISLTYSPNWLDLSMSGAWITVYNLLRNASVPADFYKICICLSVAVCGQSLNSEDLPMLVAFATNPAFRRLNPPQHPTFHLEQDRYKPTYPRVQSIVLANMRNADCTPIANWTKRADETKAEFKSRKDKEHECLLSKHQRDIILHYLAQWPSAFPSSPPRYEPCWLWFDIESCTQEVVEYFGSCAKNIELRAHFLGVEQVLSATSVSEDPPANKPVVLEQARAPELDCLAPLVLNSTPSLSYLMSVRPGPENEHPISLPGIGLSKRTSSPVETSRLRCLFDEFRGRKDPLGRRYGGELDESRIELSSKQSFSLPGETPPHQLFVQHRQICKIRLELAFKQLKRALGPINSVEQIMSAASIWPRLTPRTLLGCLSLKARTQYDADSGWRDMLTYYAQALIEYQRSQRLVILAESGDIEELLQELDTEDFPGSDVYICDPDWLLVQIDGNFRVRTIQRRVAHEMITPSSSANTALQLNMGEGKSSVIVPIIAAVLADTKKLVRVIVLKPLWRQMLHILVNRLSGLVHRRIYYLPFARNVQLDSSQANKLQELYVECMREGGILLAQPEHILSFKLMGIDYLVSKSQSKRAVSTRLRDMQQWLTANTRDILDESDEILHVQYQLIYTVGTQRPLEGHPDRWTIVQHLLRATANNFSQLTDSAKEALIYESKGSGQYPIMRIMPDCDPDVEKQLVVAIANDVLDSGLPGLSFHGFSRQGRELLARFLTDKDIMYEDCHPLLAKCSETTRKGLLLLRGLLALGVLVFVLKNKRYRVDYGLDLTRSLLAVPYRAKDVPSLRAEFGHPDVAIMLTCLSYYYKGLTNDQLINCFDLLYKLDNPVVEYGQWVRHSHTVPRDILQLDGVNTKDLERFNNRVAPVFSYNCATIDFFLSSVVFPKETKGYPHKLATSGWDLAEPKTHLTTGFSGTNDNRYLLPTTITQSDSVQQLSTNALVLTYLLQPENNHYLCMRDATGGSLTTQRFLKLLVDQEPEIRVLLDVGAQMLELRNEELVQSWLALRPDIEAAVCFSDKDELIVVSRTGAHSPYYSSPFSQQLDKCLIYLDDGHTRGTDLKLPRDFRALVTLGPKVTKDRLLQGCMRMRKLGHGQSIVFAAPPEIDRQIRHSAPQPLAYEARVDVLDILRWTMIETCKELHYHAPNWARQGFEYGQRATAEAQYSSSGDVEALKRGWLKPESRSLDDMYGVKKAPDSLDDALAAEVLGVPELRERIETTGTVTLLNDSRINEEQEREVSHEVERQQQVENPPNKLAARHRLHNDILYFVETGVPPAQTDGIVSLFRPLTTSTPHMANAWSPRLLASVDFLETVRETPASPSDYMRPVNWVLRGSDGIYLILSPFEVNELLPLIRQSGVVQIHVYAPRTNHVMKSFSDLQFYPIPRTQPILPPTSALSRDQLQLDLFAGQLYLPNYEGYLLLSGMLGIYPVHHKGSDRLDVQTESDGFLTPRRRRQVAKCYPELAQCSFTTSPIPILKELIGRRRKGKDYVKTHVGNVLYSRSMTPDDFNEGSQAIWQTY